MRNRGSRSAGRKACRFKRALGLEQLEVRHLLSAGATSTLLSSGWFADYLTPTEQRHANPPSLSTLSTAHAASPSPGSSAQNEYDWIVQFKAGALGGIASAAQTASLLAPRGIDFQFLRGLGQVGEVLVRSEGATASQAATALRSDARVASYELDSLRQVQSVPSDTSFALQWALDNAGQSGGTAGDDIHATDAWNISTGSRNVVVAVLDTGIDYTHPDLVPNLWTNPIANDGFAGDLHGYNFCADTGNATDDNGHGTHVAGIIGADGNNGQGVTGVNWSVSLMSLKFMAADGSGYTSDAIRAINYATMLRTQYGVNIRVINASWGGGGYDASLYSAIQSAGNAGILFVAAAGNMPISNDSDPQYPASYNLPNVIAVAATDQNDQLANFSGYGASTVQLAAPGTQIYSTYVGGGYTYLSGTSMASPEVAGVAALAWAVAPNDSVAQIRSAILQGVDQLPSLAGKVTTGGRLDAYNTLRILAKGQSSTPAIASLIASPNSVAAGGTVALAAQGVAEPGGTITGVSFYLDTDGNGQWDAGDRLVGSTTIFAAGQATITMDTTGIAAGNYELFARAVDSNNQWSPAVSTQLTVLPATSAGHNYATAMPATVGTTVSGNIANANLANFYKFQAVAGTSYVFQTTLGTLYDSVLTLLGHDGQIVIAQNDDIASGNLASRVAWQAPNGGTYYLVVASYPASGGGTFGLQLTALGGPPTVSPIANQNLKSGGSLSIAAAASDPAGGPLTYSAQALTIDPFVQAAYDYNRRLGLSATTQWPDNSRGWHERYLLGSNSAVYFIVPSGKFYQLVNISNIAQSVLLGQFTATYYNNPALLYNPDQPSYSPAPAGTVSVTTSKNVVKVHPASGFVGNIQMVVTVSDGQASAAQSFVIAVGSSASNQTRSLSTAESQPGDCPNFRSTKMGLSPSIADQTIASGSWADGVLGGLPIDLRTLGAILEAQHRHR